ncbi:hypothetical protein SH1V18_07490 [Vallitalea longa]|uniref:WYL domain-containing protein n=1 Tax=Vallitalea longa TaxID=2936439 RepID=A0A9W5YA96_9FIRM|nr:WYL domain-containing protein [Vallitalea longa]GKX28269.1 hypothetical protein SH1V18_07490 [Vallitalea longa]
MSVFSEIYGRYYQLLNELLHEAHKKPISTVHIYNLLQEKGFGDTALALAPKIINDDKDSYNLLYETQEGYKSILKKKQKVVLTTLELRWLKTILIDKRIKLFFNEEEMKIMENRLSDVDELFNPDDIISINQANDGDPYDDPNYIDNFRRLLYCVNNKKCMTIIYKNSQGVIKKASYAGYRLEYSVKDDKFRLNAVLINRSKIVFHSKINVARIIKVAILEKSKYPSEIAEFIYAHRMSEPIEIIIKNKRNGFERVFVHLSNYERDSEYDEETNTCRIKIHYYDFDETELIIQLIAFGPILKVVGPESFKKKIIDRINRQMELFKLQ